MKDDLDMLNHLPDRINEGTLQVSVDAVNQYPTLSWDRIYHVFDRKIPRLNPRTYQPQHPNRSSLIYPT